MNHKDQGRGGGLAGWSKTNPYESDYTRRGCSTKLVHGSNIIMTFGTFMRIWGGWPLEQKFPYESDFIRTFGTFISMGIAEEGGWFASSPGSRFFVKAALS